MLTQIQTVYNLPVGRLVGRSAGQIGRSVGLPVDQSAEGSVSWFSDRSESRYIYNFDQYGAVVWLRTSISGSHDRSGTGWRDGRSAGWSAGADRSVGRSVGWSLGRRVGRLVCRSVGGPAHTSHGFCLSTTVENRTKCKQPCICCLAERTPNMIGERTVCHPDHPWLLSPGLAMRGLWMP